MIPATSTASAPNLTTASSVDMRPITAHQLAAHQLAAQQRSPLRLPPEPVQRVCDHLLGDLRAAGCVLEQVSNVTAFAHALACWRGITIVFKPDGPTPDLRLPRRLPLFALELWSGTLAIVYHADLAPARQSVGVLHVLAHFLLLWNHPPEAESSPRADFITCAYHFLPSQEHLQEAGSDALPENTAISELAWAASHSQRNQQIPQFPQSAPHRVASAVAALPERGVGRWDSAWEPYAIELTRRFLSSFAGEPMHL